MSECRYNCKHYDWSVGTCNGECNIEENYSVIYRQGYRKAIDEFMSAIKEHQYVLCDRINSTDYGMFTCGLEQIAEQLKEHK